MSFHVEDHSDAWNDTFAHPDATHELGSDLSFPKFRIRVGVTRRHSTSARTGRAKPGRQLRLARARDEVRTAPPERGPGRSACRCAAPGPRRSTSADMEMHAPSPADAEAGRHVLEHASRPTWAWAATGDRPRETADAVSLRTARPSSSRAGSARRRGAGVAYRDRRRGGSRRDQSQRVQGVARCSDPASASPVLPRTGRFRPPDLR